MAPAGGAAAAGGASVGGAAAGGEAAGGGAAGEALLHRHPSVMSAYTVALTLCLSPIIHSSDLAMMSLRAFSSCCMMRSSSWLMESLAANLRNSSGELGLKGIGLIYGILTTFRRYASRAACEW